MLNISHRFYAPLRFRFAKPKRGQCQLRTSSELLRHAPPRSYPSLRSGTLRDLPPVGQPVMRPLHHVLLALLDGIHHLLQDLLRRFIIIDDQWFFESHGKLNTLLLELQTFLIKSPPESTDHHGNNNRPGLFDDMCRALSAGRKGLGGALRKSDHPTVLERPVDLP